MSSNLEARLLRLEGLIHAQGNTISEQQRIISEQGLTIARLSAESQAQEATDRHHDRTLFQLSKEVFAEGQWVEEGTTLRRAKSEQSWKVGGEGPISKRWEWQRYTNPPTNHFDRLPEELVAMIFELCYPTDLNALCQVSYPFLARASLLLYREITLDGKAATKIFCERPEDQRTRESRVSQHLSFGNTRKITLESGQKPHQTGQKPLKVHNDRFACRHSANLKLDSVALKTNIPTWDLGFWNPVLSLLDPYHVKLYGAQHDQFRYPRTCPLPGIGCPFLDTWTRLESVTSMGEIVFVHPNNTIALVPTVPTRRPRHIEYQIHQAPPKGEGGKTIELLDGERVLEIMQERWEPKVGLWTYLRVTLVDDKDDDGEPVGRKAGGKRVTGPAGAAGKRKARKAKAKKRPTGEVEVSLIDM